MKMLLLSTVPEERLRALRAACPGATFVAVASEAEQLREIVDADAVYGWPRREALAVARRLRWVHVGSAGIERVRDLPELVEGDVLLTNGRGTMARSVADHVFGLILTFTRRLRELAEDQAARHWTRERRLGLMKPTACLIAVSRGGIVDEAALVDALRRGRLAGAGLDVAEQEPLPPDSPLWDAPNLVLTPHCSGSSPQTHERLWALLAENVRRFVAGEALLNPCDKRAGY